MITEPTLRVYGIPERVVAARATFLDLDSACQAAATMIAAGLCVERCDVDVAATVSSVPQAIRRTLDSLERLGVTAAILGHVGDGSYHLVFMFDSDDPAEVEQARFVDEEQAHFALELGGTAEHGVRIGKSPHLVLEDENSIETIRAIKNALDTNGINPGKLLPS